MKTWSPASVGCCAAFLIMTAPVMVRAASNTVALTDTEPQYASHLCWAAVDVLAVNYFYPKCPTPPPSTPPPTPTFFPTSQATETGYQQWLSSGGTPPNWGSGAAPLNWYLWNTCGTQIGNCNYWGNPPLHGLSFLPGPGSGGLDWDTVTQEIDAGRPFLFVWKYPPDGVSADSPVDSHELAATGYSDERDSSHTRYLQIWDPWPQPAAPLPSKVPLCGPANGYELNPGASPHSQWILFSTYADPSTVDMGVQALHTEDQWHLIPLHVPEAPVLTVDDGMPPLVPLPPPIRPSPHPSGMPLRQVGFAEALNGALLQSQQLDLRVAGAAPRSLGVPFPIIGLGFLQLLRAQHEPSALLAGTTSAILFPVESKGEVVDAFLMLFKDGHWQRGGYANLGITQRLVEVRSSYATKHHVPLDSLYMVSVPGEVAFFAAYGKGKQAVLIPASTDPTIDAVAGSEVLADKQLRRLIQVIQRDLRTDRRRATARRGP